MKLRMYHPWWVHVPALAAWLAVAALLLIEVPRLPERVPLHFDYHFLPDRYGSPQEMYLVLLLPLLFVPVSAWLDELWVRQELSKAFNWFTLFDEAVVGLLLATALSGLEAARQPAPARLRFHWVETAAILFVTVGLAALLEWRRPFRAVRRPAQDGAAVPDAELLAHLRAGGRWVHWEAQNPAWNNVLVAVTAPLLLFLAVLVVLVLPAPRILRWAVPGVLVPAALSVTTFYGGFTTRVTAEHLEVRLGIFGVRLLRLRIGELAGARVHSFSALRDYGGWGIRWGGKRGWAYLLRGGRGVLVETQAGRRYLIGSDAPDRLAAAVRSAMAAQR